MDISGRYEAFFKALAKAWAVIGAFLFRTLMKLFPTVVYCHNSYPGTFYFVSKNGEPRKVITIGFNPADPEDVRLSLSVQRYSGFGTDLTKEFDAQLPEKPVPKTRGADDEAESGYPAGKFKKTTPSREAPDKFADDMHSIVNALGLPKKTNEPLGPQEISHIEIDSEEEVVFEQLPIKKKPA